MKINIIENTTNFKKIKLSRKDASVVGRLISEYQKNNNPNVVAEVVDIFKPYIEKESNLVYKNFISKSDCQQDLYLILIEKFRKLREKTHPVVSLVNYFNNNIQKNISSKQILPHKPIEHYIDKKEISVLSDFDKEISNLEIVKSLIAKTNSLSRKEETVLNKFLDSENYSEIAKCYGFSNARILQILKDCVHKIKMVHNKEYRLEYERLHPPKTRKI